MIHCFNPGCQTGNPDSNATCQVCRWPLVRRYLWVLGEGAADLPVGTVLGDRYRVVQSQIVLDTQPAQPVKPLETVPDSAQPYLQLSDFLRAIPRPFTQLTIPQTGKPLLFLEEAPIHSDPQAPGNPPVLLPSLQSAWAHASALHQLSWLWQLAQLWQPLSEKQVASTLLMDDLIRVEGEDIRLLALNGDDTPPTLAALGSQWQGLGATAAPSLHVYLTALGQALTQGTLSPDALSISLTQALEQLSAGAEVSVQLATYSDQGPTRQRNEDACAPPSGSVQTTRLRAADLVVPAPLVIVCDGIGGHQGGDVASQLAIKTVTAHLQSLTQTPNLPHATLVAALADAVLAANQAIGAENDQNQRQARDRMGTTLVMALVYGARLYLAHLGDSRAYRVRADSCRQVTLDDDVASREMRLGYGFYREALQNPGAGSLVQALGVGDSRHLHPTVQLHLLAEDSLFLLCSDGLSDNDLIDRLWTLELRPVLQGQRSVAEAGQRLIQQANTHNGHDNVTLGVIRVSAPTLGTPPPLSPALVQATPPLEPALRPATVQIAPAPAGKSRWSPTGQRPSPWLSVFLSGTLVIALVAGVVAVFWEAIALRLTALIDPAPAPANSGSLAPSAAPPTPIGDDAPTALSVGDLLQIQQLPEAADPAAALTVTPAIPDPALVPAVGLPEHRLSVGSTVKVVNRQKTAEDQLWVFLKVCSVPASASAIAPPEGVSPSAEPEGATRGDRPPPLLPAGGEGWIQEASLQPVVRRLIDTTPAQQGLCMD